MGANRSREIHESVELLQLAGACDRQESGDGDLAVVAARSKHNLPPLNGGPERALGDVVRRLDPLLVHEGKEVRKCRNSARTRFRTSSLAASTERPASAKNFFSSGSTFVINCWRVSGAPRACGSPLKRCHRRNRRFCRARASRQKRLAAGVLASSCALRRFLVKCDQQN